MLLCLAGCKSSSNSPEDVSKKEPFAKFVGETFVLNVQGLISKPGEHYELLGLTDRVREFYGLPQTIDSTMLNREFNDRMDPGITVIQTLPKGTRFRVTGVKHTRTFGGPNYPYLEIVLLHRADMVSGSLVSDALMMEYEYGSKVFDFRFRSGQVTAVNPKLKQYTEEKRGSNKIRISPDS